LAGIINDDDDDDDDDNQCVYSSSLTVY